MYCDAVGIMGNVTVINISSIDSALCCVHTLLFTVVTISLLLQWLMKPSPVERSFLPSHTSRTILMLTLIAIQVLLLLKDILSAVPGASSYIAWLLTVLGTTAGLVYSDIVGNSRPLSVAIMLLLYWFICATLWVLRLTVCFLLRSPQATEVDACLLFDAVILLLYFGLLILECAWIFRNVCTCINLLTCTSVSISC